MAQKPKFEVMSNAEYRQREGLSSSDIKRMMKSMATWKYYKDNPQEDQDTPALKFGRAYHKICLEPYDFENEFAIVPKIDKRSKEGKELYAKFLAENGNKELIDEEMYQKLTEMRDVLYKTPLVKELIVGEHEKSFFWVDKQTGIPCKFRADSFGKFKGQGIIVDLKTVADAETTAFMRSAMKFNYDVQAAHYLEGMRVATGEDYKFVFIAQEKEKPYLVNILEADEYFIKNGQEVRQTMIETYKKCIELDEYPAFLGFKEDKIFFNSLSCPAWVRNAIDEESETDD